MGVMAVRLAQPPCPFNAAPHLGALQNGRTRGAVIDCSDAILYPGHDMAPTRKKRMTRLAGMIDGMVAPSVQKRGFIISKLVSQWPLIAGDIAAWSRPSQMNLSRDGGGTLKLAIASGFGPIALQMKQPIIERVNAAFGYRAINDVVFIQTLPPPRPDTARTTTESASASDPKKVWELDAKLEKVSSPELRAALRRLGLDD